MKRDLKRILKDKLTREVLTFFYQNQSSVDSAGGVSAWVSDDRERVQSALDRMVELGVVEKDSMGSTNGYCYTRDEKIMKVVKSLMQDV